LTEQQKTSEIATINQQLATLKEQASKANAETEKHIEKRDKLNEQFRKLRQQINELKDERNCLNEKVKTLKQQRDEARTKIRTIIEEIKMRTQKITELMKKTPKRSQRELQEEFENVEWKIQTTSLDLQEEKRLVENVKQLETQLNVYKKIEKQNMKITELRNKLQTLEKEGDTAHKELTVTAQKSQEIHANMLAKISESKNIKAEADSLHGAYLQANEQAKPLNEEIKKLLERRKKLQEEIRIEDERKKKTAEQDLKEKLGSQARDKLRRGEKLSWNEFQLLAEDDPQTQD
jgi:uncharacterized coiled-coil DUF342 family protein